MCEELITLAGDFDRYRGDRKTVKYPQDFWDKATQLCQRHPIKEVARSLGVSYNSMQRQLRSQKSRDDHSPQFAPINIATHPSVQLRISGPLPITIDFDRSTEELIQLILSLQGGIRC